MAEPIRVLHVLNSVNRGGAETMLVNQYRAIDRSRVQFDFVIHTKEEGDYSDEIKEMGGRIYRFPHYSGKNHFRYKTAWGTFLNAHPEHQIIHGHLRSTAAVYLGIAKKYGRITIAHSHSTASRGNRLERLAKSILQFPTRHVADYFFACSDDAGKWLFGSRVTRQQNYRVIRNAIDAEKYRFSEPLRHKIRNELGLRDAFVLGHVGSFTHPKNHKFLVEVFSEVHKKNGNAVLLLLGDGELRSEIEKQLAYLGLRDKAILAGVVPNVSEYLQGMDVFVFPSWFEGLGMVLIEAQACGLPCLASATMPRESDLGTGLYHRFSLDESPSRWAEEILSLDNARIDSTLALNESGWNVMQTASWMQEFYIGAGRSERVLK